MEGRPAECLLAKSMISDEELDGLFADVVGGGKKEGKKEKGLAIGVKGQHISGGNVVGVWGDGGEVSEKE